MSKLLKIGCGCAVLLLVGLAAFVIWWYRTGMEGPRGVAVGLSLPVEARVGEEVELAVAIRNLRPADSFRLDDIAIDNSFHDAFSVIGVTPSPELQHDMRLAVVVLYRFGIEVAPGDEQVIVFRLRAEKPGRAAGEMTISEGRRALVEPVSLQIRP